MSKHEQSLQQFRDNPFVKNLLAGMNLEVAARGLGPKLLLPAPEHLTALGIQQLEVEDRTLAMVRKYGMPRLKTWLDRNELAPGVPWEDLAEVRTIIQRSLQIDEEMAIRQPAVWFDVPLFERLRDDIE